MQTEQYGGTLKNFTLFLRKKSITKEGEEFGVQKKLKNANLKLLVQCSNKMNFFNVVGNIAFFWFLSHCAIRFNSYNRSRGTGRGLLQKSK